MSVKSTGKTMNAKQRLVIELAEDAAKVLDPKEVIANGERAERDIRLFEQGWIAGRLRGVADGLKAAGIANADLQALGEAFSSNSARRLG